MLRYIYIIILLSYNIAIAESGLTVNYNWEVNLTDKDLNHIVTWAKQTREKKMIILRAIDAELQRETSSIKRAELKEIANKSFFFIKIPSLLKYIYQYKILIE